MVKKTHTNNLSWREIEQLKNNPFIASVSTKSVKFTEEFKQLVYENKLKGISVSETLRKCGIDPDILGLSRIKGFAYQLNKKAKQNGDFSDRQLENELAYTRQEVEFLKKLQAANMEAQKQWESRHRQK